tara:strand:+ start:50 stop:706 length:657 start_codon:yes stop_codon:yes gene_type:complete
MKTFFFDSIYNTQEFALKELSSESIFVTSFSQEKGKGTSNREWLNADQAIACSLALFEEQIKIAHTLIPLVAGFAFVKVFQDIDLTLKWPNDIIFNEKKVGGILVQKVEDKICIGMGVNYFWETPSVPNAGSIFNTHQDDTKLKDDAENWAKQLEGMLKNNNFDLDEYKSRLQTIGKLVEYPEGRGWAEDINEDGSLQIKTVDEKIINLTSPLITEVN